MHACSLSLSLSLSCTHTHRDLASSCNFLLQIREERGRDRDRYSDRRIDRKAGRQTANTWRRAAVDSYEASISPTTCLSLSLTLTLSLSVCLSFSHSLTHLLSVSLSPLSFIQNEHVRADTHTRIAASAPPSPGGAGHGACHGAWKGKCVKTDVTQKYYSV